MNRLLLLKIIVFFMTFLLVFGLLAALGVVFQKSRHQIPEQQTFSLNEPKGSAIAKTEVHETLLYLTLTGGGPSDRIVVFDTASGQTILKLTLN